MKRFVWLLALLTVAMCVGTGWGFFYKKQGTPIKNLQVLPFKDSRETIAYMSQQAKELGVRCDHCHNVKDYSSDEKEAKLTARRMIRMVQLLNSQGFSWEGAPQVTCWECHNGKPEPPENLVAKEKIILKQP